MKQPVVTVLEGGRITIPKAIRDRRGWSGGTRLIIEFDSEGVCLKTPPAGPAKGGAQS
ncbi:MAG: AbrB/MazE/SpoVT family DNA-binding domain-containing protein [Caulobacteraceae bacterium]|nr:AbrB/MazE/SpoVT family DNA-binding domain-containing protein [Caulobacteraceae bacterium]